MVVGRVGGWVYIGLLVLVFRVGEWAVRNKVVCRADRCVVMFRVGELVVSNNSRVQVWRVCRQ